MLYQILDSDKRTFWMDLSSHTHTPKRWVWEPTDWEFFSWILCLCLPFRQNTGSKKPNYTKVEQVRFQSAPVLEDRYQTHAKFSVPSLYIGSYDTPKRPTGNPEAHRATSFLTQESLRWTVHVRANCSIRQTHFFLKTVLESSSYPPNLIHLICYKTDKRLVAWIHCKPANSSVYWSHRLKRQMLCLKCETQNVLCTRLWGTTVPLVLFVNGNFKSSDGLCFANVPRTQDLSVPATFWN